MKICEFITVLKVARTRVSDCQLNESCCGDETRIMAAYNTVINNSRFFYLDKDKECFEMINST